MSIGKIAKETKKSPSTVRYWLQKFGLKTQPYRKKETIKKQCPICNVEKDVVDFYKRRGRIGTLAYCISCTKKQATERQKNLKREALNYKGGKCEKCGYVKCNAALEFHHTNPKEKDFSISKLKNYRFNEKIKKELDKCVLLCANCHREEHEIMLL